MLARHAKWCRCLAQKRSYSAGSSHPHVAVVGGGPGGYYAAQQILKVCASANSINADIFRIVCTT